MAGGWAAKGNGDIVLRAARGWVTGHSTFIVRGDNLDLDLAAEEDLVPWGSVQYLTAAETVSIVSDDAADDAGSTGVTAVLVQGTCADNRAQQEVVVLNGTGAVLTTNSYLRVNTLVSTACGSGGTNAGTITATASSAGYTMSQILPGEGIAHAGIYTVPADTTASIVRVEFSAVKPSGQSPLVTFFGNARTSSTAPWLTLFESSIDTGTLQYLPVETPSWPSFGPGTEIRMSASTTKDNTLAYARMYLYLGPKRTA